jgi:hypothetical protein
MQGSSVLFPAPDPWPEHVDTAALLGELATTLRRYVLVPQGAATAIALWIAHTHALDAARISPRLAILSPVKRCGKTTLLKLLATLVRSALATANLTAPVLFRVVEAHKPTLLVDEADTFLAGKEELRGILNAGHDRDSGKVVRCGPEDFEPRIFSAWAAVAIAAIGKLPDTLADRSIVVSMRRKAAGESVEPCRRSQREALVDLRRKCERWAVDFVPRLRDAQPNIPASLNDRAADNWEALLAIADLAGQTWGERARKSAMLLSGVADGEEPSTRAEALLADLRTVFFVRDADRLSTKMLLADLTKLEGRPWAELNRGRPLSDHQLGRMLSHFAIHSGTIRLPDGTTPKGYKREALEDAWARYLRAYPSATSATNVESLADSTRTEAPQEPSVADASSTGSACSFNDVAGVADQGGVTGWESGDGESVYGGCFADLLCKRGP